MKAFSRKTITQKVKQETDKYLTQEYDRLAYEAVKAQAPYLMRQTEAMILYALSQHGYGQKRLNEIHEWFLGITRMPDILGKTPKCGDCMKYLTDKFGIDFSEVNPRMESWEEFQNGTKG